MGDFRTELRQRHASGIRVERPLPDENNVVTLASYQRRRDRDEWREKYRAQQLENAGCLPRMNAASRAAQFRWERNHRRRQLLARIGTGLLYTMALAMIAATVVFR